MHVNWFSCLRKSVEISGVYPCGVGISWSNFRFVTTMGLKESTLLMNFFSFLFCFFNNNFFTRVVFSWFYSILKYGHPALTLSCFASSIGLFPLCWCLHKTVSRGNTFYFKCISLGLDWFGHTGCCKYIMKCASKTLGCIPEEWCLWRCSHSLPASE